MVDCGVDAVVCHHTHYISGYEYYKGKPIFYGLGNYAFNYKKLTDDELYTGILLSISFSDIDKISLCLKLIEYNKSKLQLTFLSKDKRDKVLKRIDIYNLIIGNEDLLRDYWAKQDKRLRYKLFSQISSNSRFFYRIKKKLFKIRSKITCYKRLSTLSITRRDSHNEMIKRVLKNKGE